MDGKDDRRLYKRADSPYWQCLLRDPATGRRARLSTGTADREKACAVYDGLLRSYEEVGAPMTLRRLLVQYQDPATNPRYREAQECGFSYSPGWARWTAGCARRLERVLDERLPRLPDRPLDSLRAADLAQVRDALARSMGRTGAAAKAFQAVKAMLQKAKEDGIVARNVAAGQRNIKYERKPQRAIPAPAIRRLLERPELLGPREAWAFLLLAAATGMRRGELMGLAPCQLDGGTLVVDRAYKAVLSKKIWN